MRDVPGPRVPDRRRIVSSDRHSATPPGESPDLRQPPDMAGPPCTRSSGGRTSRGAAHATPWHWSQDGREMAARYAVGTSVPRGHQSAEPAVYRRGPESGVGRRPHLSLDHGRLARSGCPAGPLFTGGDWVYPGKSAHGGVDAAGVAHGAAATAPEPRSAPSFGSRESVCGHGLPAATAGRRHDQKYVASRNCWDNACVESFFDTLKRELIHHQQYRTREEARQDIFEYLEVFYNRQRRHSTLGYQSPADFEARVAVA